MKKRLKFLPLVMAVIFALLLSGCGMESVDSFFATMRGELIGNSYTVYSYDNFGNKSLEVHGDKISLAQGEDTLGEDSSYVDITIDGLEWNHVGGTLIFIQDDADIVTDFDEIGVIESPSKSSGLISVDRFVNSYRNIIGKKSVVLIYSQTGTPICMLQGDSCYAETPSDLPKTTKLSIDGKQVYIHHANIDIIPAEMIH